MNAMGAYWHPDHFICSVPDCKASLADATYYEREEKAYCQSHYIKLFSHQCHSCRLPILSDPVKAVNKYWHSTCVKCDKCSKQLDTVFLNETNGKMYCSDHASNLLPISVGQCGACGREVLDRGFVQVSLGGLYYL